MVNIEEEIINCIMVCTSALASACYCYAVSKMVTQATLRFFTFLPVLCLFFLLPLTLKSINLIGPIVFAITWIATFKIILLVFNTGPLSNPSLSLFHFVVISCLPLIFHHPTAPKQKHNNLFGNTNIYQVLVRSFPHFAIRGLLMVFLVYLVANKHRFPLDMILFCICMYLYLGMEVVLGVAAIVGQILLGDQVEVEPPFHRPYLSTSLQDFWGRRWNRVGSNSLRFTIFKPILRHSLPILSKKWAALVALLVTFLASELLHEIMFYYMDKKRMGSGTLLFFLLQGGCVAIEVMLKRRIKVRWEVPQVMKGLLIFGFVVCTFMSLVLPEFLEHGADERVIEEYAAFGAFVKELVLTWSKISYHLLVQPSMMKQI